MTGIGGEFIEKTKYRYLKASDQSLCREPPPLEDACDTQAPLIALTPVKDIRVPDMPLRRAVEQRRSIRNYARQSLTIDELSFLLWCTQGVREAVPPLATFRNVPSAGARHPFETCLLVRRVDALQPGLYRYLAIPHRLLPGAKDPDLAERIRDACLGQRMVQESAVTFLWIAVPCRTTWRYGERGYRYLCMEAGHICQNLYLAAESIDCGVYALAAFSDDDLNRLLKLDGRKRFVLYLASVGKKDGNE